jgi:hypothetical protein
MMAATRDALDALREPHRAELAFLYSTPAYRRQLEYFGFGEAGDRSARWHAVAIGATYPSTSPTRS